MEIKKWLGLRNVTSDERLTTLTKKDHKSSFMETADNVDIDDTGKVMTRLKATLAQAGSYHSLWSDGDVALVMSGKTLYRMNPDISLTALTTVSSDRRMSYARQQNITLLSNGIDKLRLHLDVPLMWGTPQARQPTAALTSGGLPAGTYQYALTHLRGDGMESGTGTAGSIELPVPGGIEFANIEASIDPEVTDKLIYLSAPDGSELFRAFAMPAAATTAAYRGSVPELTLRLETQFASPPPAGDIVALYNACAYVAVGNMVFYSDPYALERFKMRTQFLQFTGEVTMLAPVNDGIYVSTIDRTWFLQGRHPSEFKSFEVLDYGAIAGTAARTTVEALRGSPDPAGRRVVVWTTPSGICLGGDGGVVVNLTERNFSFPSAQRGAGIVRQARGITQYLAALEGSGVAHNSYS